MNLLRYIATLRFTCVYWLSLNVFIIECICEFNSIAIMRHCLKNNVILHVIGEAYNVSTLTLRWIQKCMQNVLIDDYKIITCKLVIIIQVHLSLIIVQLPRM